MESSRWCMQVSLSFYIRVNGYITLSDFKSTQKKRKGCIGNNGRDHVACASADRDTNVSPLMVNGTSSRMMSMLNKVGLSVSGRIVELPMKRISETHAVKLV